MARVKICFSEIPEADRRALCDTVLNSVKRFYENPVNLREFEKWLSQKEANDGNSCNRNTAGNT